MNGTHGHGPDRPIPGERGPAPRLGDVSDLADRDPDSITFEEMLLRFCEREGDGHTRALSRGSSAGEALEAMIRDLVAAGERHERLRKRGRC